MVVGEIDEGLGSCHRSRLGSGSSLSSSLGLRVRDNRAKLDKGAYKFKVGSWNIETLHGKSIKLVKILGK